MRLRVEDLGRILQICESALDQSDEINDTISKLFDGAHHDLRDDIDHLEKQMINLVSVIEMIMDIAKGQDLLNTQKKDEII